ncbi:MAG: UDP-N-acetylmuramate--L-alanine ligase [Bacteroidota bacterium]
MSLKKYDNVYFIGIGGIGMSALARWFKHNGYHVYGYDRTETSLTNSLQTEGIPIHFDDDVDNIPYQFKEDRTKTVVVYTPAIPASNSELTYFRELGFDLFKRSEILGMITENVKTIAVAGTHGKTTTSSMIAHLLKNAGRDITAFMGGISTNYNSNFLLNDQLTEETWAVVEADEFDRSFLTLSPEIAIVTSADADHLDIYGDADSLKTSFKEFINKIKSEGKLFINDGIANDLVDSDYKGAVGTYGMNRGQFFATNITTDGGFFEFDYCDEQYKIDRLKLGVPGFHNVENAVAAIAVALNLGLSEADIKEGLESYNGVKRRFEYIIRNDQMIFIDDYAHHPVEVEAFLKSLKALYPGKKVTAIFQPHLYTRTRDFAKGFGQSLSLADEVILLDIYPAREEPIEGVSSKLIYKHIGGRKTLCSKEQVIDVLDSQEVEVLATIGAGDIDQIVQPIYEHLTRTYHES